MRLGKRSRVAGREKERKNLVIKKGSGESAPRSFAPREVELRKKRGAEAIR